ncbi:MAG: hypothetical protein P8O81_01805 [Flavobacteriaceae bacterium]|jgi:hypothetical protein|nr:hypothetical protein [Flavobacteriaceae bacterium]
MKILSIVLFLIIAVGILILSILIAPGQISNNYFWITVSWLIFLSFLNWLVSTFIFYGVKSNNTNNSSFGILPSLGIIVFIYSLFSAFFLLSTWYVNDFGLIPNWHLILQVSIALAFLTLIVIMFIAAKSSRKITSNNKLKPKSVLLNYISEIEKNNLDEEDIKGLLKQLYEIIQYSIPDVNYVKSPENYEKLCETLSSISKDNKTTELEGLIFLAKKI